MVLLYLFNLSCEDPMYSAAIPGCFHINIATLKWEGAYNSFRNNCRILFVESSANHEGLRRSLLSLQPHHQQGAVRGIIATRQFICC